jgi:LCP family protein required for cell wall assembly
MRQPQPSSHKRAFGIVRRRYGLDQPTSNKQRSPVSNRSDYAVSPESRLRSDGRRNRVHGLPPKRSWFKRFFVLLVVLIMIGIGIFGYKIIAAGDKVTTTDRSILGQLKDLLLKQGSMLEGENEGRINILLLAVGGEGHKGESLADTIMLASLDPVTNHASLLSIPRDLYVQVPGRDYYSKINAVHAYGESQKTDNGPVLLSELVTNITGQPIHYYARVDFNAFKSIIDAIGGINVTIDNSFFDYWHKISFPAGTEKMSGERALAFVRARYIEGPEGGDFKRAERQQQVLLAARDKVFSVQTALDFTKLNAILDSVSNDLRTDMQLWEMKRLYEIVRSVDPSQVQSVVLTSGPKGVLVGGTEILGGVPASILRTRTGDYSELHTLATNLLQAPDQPLEALPTPSLDPSPLPSPSPSPSPEAATAPALPTIEVLNGTTITGLAKRTSDKLAADNYDIINIGNASVRNATHTIVYYSSPDQQATADQVAQLINAQTDSPLPAAEKASTADLVIILGPDAE